MEISRHSAKSLLEGHLVARRNNVVSCPCDPTAESYYGLLRDYNGRSGFLNTCGTDDRERYLMELLG
jgi:hypothetical protein